MKNFTIKVESKVDSLTWLKATAGAEVGFEQNVLNDTRLYTIGNGDWNLLFYTILNNDSEVGYVIISTDKPTKLFGLYVKEEFRNLGACTFLIEHLLKEYGTIELGTRSKPLQHIISKFECKYLYSKMSEYSHLEEDYYAVSSRN